MTGKTWKTVAQGRENFEGKKGVGHIGLSGHLPHILCPRMQPIHSMVLFSLQIPFSLLQI